MGFLLFYFFMILLQLIHNTCTNIQFSYSSTCYSTCPSKTFADYTTMECSTCDSSCDNCIAVGNKGCTSCIASFLIIAEGICVPDCPTYDPYIINDSLLNINTCIPMCVVTFFDLKSPSNCSSTCLNFKNNSGYCLNCDISCNNCMFSNNNKSCLDCKIGDLFLPLTTDATNINLGECLSNIPLGYFNLSNVLNKCDITCLTCNGASNSICLSCPNGSYLSEFFNN